MPNPNEPSFWETYYQDTPPWDLGQPAPPLVQFLQTHPELPRGRVAVLGSGLGNDALWLAAQGFAVTGFDFVPAAIAHSTAQAQERQLAAEFLQRDLFQLLPEFAQTFDYVIEHTCYCAIDPDRRDEYVDIAAGILKPQGQFIGLFWCHDRPDGPPFGSQPESVRSLFAMDFEILSFEPVDHSIEKRKGEEYLGHFVKASISWVGLKDETQNP